MIAPSKQSFCCFVVVCGVGTVGTVAGEKRTRRRSKRSAAALERRSCCCCACCASASRSKDFALSSAWQSAKRHTAIAVPAKCGISHGRRVPVANYGNPAGRAPARGPSPGPRSRRRKALLKGAPREFGGTGTEPQKPSSPDAARRAFPENKKRARVQYQQPSEVPRVWQFSQAYLSDRA